jgi:hypothetical protein
MIEKDAVSKDFRKQMLGFGLTTAEIVYRRPVFGQILDVLAEPNKVYWSSAVAWLSTFSSR